MQVKTQKPEPQTLNYAEMPETAVELIIPFWAASTIQPLMSRVPKRDRDFLIPTNHYTKPSFPFVVHVLFHLSLPFLKYLGSCLKPRPP